MPVFHPDRSMDHVPHSFTLASLGLVIFTANAGLLVLQLVAGRILAPFIGSSLETWTVVIGIFLAGIAAGNWMGASERGSSVSRRKLVAVLLFGALFAVWPIAIANGLHRTGLGTFLPLRPRIIVLTAVMFFPVAFILSLLTPMAVRLATRNLASAGKIAGLTFALGTLGCLLGNYATGFWLIPTYSIDTIVWLVAGLLSLLAPCTSILPIPRVDPTGASMAGILPPLRRSFAIVFACSFAAMTLELLGIRLMALIMGVSLYTWTGVIGVMLMGTAFGNWLGGLIADRANRRGRESAQVALASTLVLAGASVTLSLVIYYYVSFINPFDSYSLSFRIVALSFLFFLAPMTFFGTISPQVVRLATVNAELAGAIAGRIYAVSTIGAIVGTFVTGYFLLAEFGMYRLILVVAAVPIVAAFFTVNMLKQRMLLYITSISSGVVVTGLYSITPEWTEITKETNYFTIVVRPPFDENLAADGVITLALDKLIHSWVKPHDPTYLHYAHEKIQMDFLEDQAARKTDPRVLVIGGGGYTFPRAARTLVPSCSVDVVEIDPEVTKVAYDHLALDPKLDIHSYHMDGRQFVSEMARPGTYDLITMDAVNDLSVPGHLLTKEFNDRVKTVLTPEGVYLVSIIDQPAYSSLVPVVISTLHQSFKHVEILNPIREWNFIKQYVFVIYASDVPFDLERMKEREGRQVRDPRVAAGGGLFAVSHSWSVLNLPDAPTLKGLMTTTTPMILTDQYCPIDWLMAEVFRHRNLTIK
ncbi:MAG: fused MFS/spermidine synthase [Gemmataceae bacterium]